MSKVKENYPKITFLDDDMRTDGNIKVLGRKMVSLENRINKFQNKLRNDVDVFDKIQQEKVNEINKILVHNACKVS